MAAIQEFNKVVIVGEAGVGKTCIMAQFIENKFDIDTMSSLTTQFKRKTIELKNGKNITFDIYDTAGQEKWRSIARLYYKNARVVILVYDITSKKSFEEMKNYWYEQTKQIDVENLVLAIAANKSDLYEQRQVDNSEGEEFSESVDAIFAETSAKNDSGIDILFDNIGQKILDPNFDYLAEEKKKRKKNKKKENEREEKEEKEEKVENENSNNIENKMGNEENIPPRESFRVTTKTFREPKKDKSGCCK